MIDRVCSIILLCSASIFGDFENVNVSSGGLGSFLTITVKHKDPRQVGFVSALLR